MCTPIQFRLTHTRMPSSAFRSVQPFGRGRACAYWRTRTDGTDRSRNVHRREQQATSMRCMRCGLIIRRNWLLNWTELTPFLLPHNTRHDHKQRVAVGKGQSQETMIMCWDYVKIDVSGKYTTKLITKKLIQLRTITEIAVPLKCSISTHTPV